MKFAFKFSNLIGTVYRKGNLLFTPDGNTVVAPVGNRLSLFDLRNNKSETLPIESRYNFTAVDIAPSGFLFIAINETGEALLCSLVSRTVIHRHHFRKPVSTVKFSPDGKYFAVAKDNSVFVYRTPGYARRDFTPFALERVLNTAYDAVTCVEWSSDSRLLAIGSKDMSVRVTALHKMKNFGINTLSSHSDTIVNCFFDKDSADVFTLSRNGQLCVWDASCDLSGFVIADDAASSLSSRRRRVATSEQEEGDVEDKTSDVIPDDDAGGDAEVERVRYRRTGKHFLKDALKVEGGQHINLLAACYHGGNHMLVTAFSNGSFLLHEMPDYNLIQSLNVSDHEVTAACFNPTGDWIALGSGRRGQLVVWEWQSESFVLKQQGHANNMACLAYSPDGANLVTGGDDGKVKLWNTGNGFCFVTFTDHAAGVAAVAFTQNGKAILSASLDGTVRAYDLKRYRNFKTLTAPRAVQFASLAVDTSGEVVCAGSQDTFEVFVWALQTGRLLDVLAGHESCVSGLAFGPGMESVLVSSSWDKTCRVWNLFAEKGGGREAIPLTADALTVEFRPDGCEFAVATLDGAIVFFEPQGSSQVGCIEGKRDLSSGRRDTDIITAKRLAQTQAFTTLCYSADGECILAAGRSKFVCIYHVHEQLLLKKFEVTCNHSLDAVDDFISRRKITEFGNMALVEERAASEETALSLPGVKKGDLSSRSFKPEVRVSAVSFSPTGRAWAAATTEGVLVYSLDNALVFDPFELEQGVTPATIRAAAREKDYVRAVVAAFRLNEDELTTEVIEGIPVVQIDLVCRSLPQVYVEKLLNFVGAKLESTTHVHFYVTWIVTLLKGHGEVLKERSRNIMATLRTVTKNVGLRHTELSKVCDHNKYLLSYIETLRKFKEKEGKEEGMSEGGSEDDDLSSQIDSADELMVS
ncbi:periodic tryptophan protein 2 homolog [Dermacentor variabilis]|uniref:periodic tryptophan protein 2 homolog n=1 Tax=Dermacentor variabilis TaxID=34621 RepID=UPI003F5BEAD6